MWKHVVLDLRNDGDGVLCEVRNWIRAVREEMQNVFVVLPVLDDLATLSPVSWMHKDISARSCPEQIHALRRVRETWPLVKVGDQGRSHILCGEGGALATHFFCISGDVVRKSAPKR